MAGKPGKGHKFLPGVSGNPSGRPKIPGREDLKQIQLMSKTDVKKIFQKYLDKTLEELQFLAQNPMNITALDVLVIKVIEKALVDGDHHRFDFLINRTVGKVAEDKGGEVIPVVYKTSVRGDGALIQEVLSEDGMNVEKDKWVDNEVPPPKTDAPEKPQDDISEFMDDGQ